MKVSFIQQLIKQVPPRSLARFYLDIFDTDLSHLPDANLVPTMCVLGKHDKYLKGFVLPPSMTKKKNYHVVWLECGHYIPRECPEQLAKLIEECIA